MEFDTGTGKLYGAIVAELSSYAGRAISSANLMNELENENREIANGITDLIRFGVIEHVNTSASNAHLRIRLREPVPDTPKRASVNNQDAFVWLAYFVDEHNYRE